MGFVATLLYLALSLVRPGELYVSLANSHVMDIAAVLAAAATTVSLLAGRRPSFRSPQLFLVVGFIVWAGFSVFAAQHWLGGVVLALEALATSGYLFLLITFNVDTLSRLEWTRRLLILLSLWLVFQGASAYFFHYGEEKFVVHQRDADSAESDSTPGLQEEALPALPTDADVPDEPLREDVVPAEHSVRRVRALGFLNDPNDLAQALAAVLPLVFVGWRPRRLLRNMAAVLAPAAVIVGGIALTRSRGGIVAVATMTLAAIIVLAPRVVSVAATLLAGTGLLAALAAARTYIRQDESSLGRIEAWSDGLQMVRSSPVWGVGFKGFREFSVLVAHNSFIHCFAELGAVGYGLWLCLILVTYYDVFAMSATRSAVGDRSGGPEDAELRRWAIATGLALVGFLGGALFLSRSYSTILFLFIALPTALADIARRSGRRVAAFAPIQWALVVVVLEIATVVVAYAMIRLIR